MSKCGLIVGSLNKLNPREWTFWVSQYDDRAILYVWNQRRRATRIGITYNIRWYGSRWIGIYLALAASFEQYDQIRIVQPGTLGRAWLNGGSVTWPPQSLCDTQTCHYHAILCNAPTAIGILLPFAYNNLYVRTSGGCGNGFTIQ